ncbi:MAG: prealbumin-like fold domain-containing protein [Thermomicrobiales bacterium]|nr:prealbumin-like fold domain-containing protein [Thermomicrobiales bacterium]MCO5224039.1 prealbumin-like fold domain-containing protein [Thermomicrobiales bacterium]MCO5226859.1 prealbumin-like fold domain-containing protein [Thermomicrobiales bacterium]
MITRTPRLHLSIAILLGLLLTGWGISPLQASDRVDARIWTESETGEPVYDICYTLVEFSNLGCDENLDGAVFFQDLAPGRYYIEPTMKPGSEYYVEPFYAVIDEYNTDIIVTAARYQVPQQQDVIQVTDVHLITRDPKTGESLTDVCYELVGYSNIGCDRNADGHVTFADIPLGQYTIRQTTTPAGYPKMDDYIVMIMGGPDGYIAPVNLVLAQSKTQAPQDRYNMSVVFWERGNESLISGSLNCAQLWRGDIAVTNIGCDEDVVDGQIDFMGVEFDANDDTFVLDIELGCGFVQVDTPFQLLWVGEHSFLLFVEVAPTGTGCH